MSRIQIPTCLRPIPALVLALLAQPDLAGTHLGSPRGRLPTPLLPARRTPLRLPSRRKLPSDRGLAASPDAGPDLRAGNRCLRLLGQREAGRGARLLGRHPPRLARRSRDPRTGLVRRGLSRRAPGRGALDGSWTLRGAFRDRAPAGAGRRCLAGGALPGLRPARAPAALRGAAGPAWGAGAGGRQPPACPRRAGPGPGRARH